MAINKTRRRMGAVVETPAVYLDMTAEENLIMQYQILGIPNYNGITELLTLVSLVDCGKKKVKDFSLGMKQRLGIAVALCGSPDFLILDEPINGLSNHYSYFQSHFGRAMQTGYSLWICRWRKNCKGNRCHRAGIKLP